MQWSCQPSTLITPAEWPAVTWQLQATLDKPVLPGDFWREDRSLCKTQCTHLSYQGLGKRFPLSGGTLREGGISSRCPQGTEKSSESHKLPWCSVPVVAPNVGESREKQALLQAQEPQETLESFRGSF